MHFGYPGENTHFENHGVSEESFWPSFTDIMMVIVMVFLLVTVAVILNNWSLIGDLKKSIEAQKIASSLAENRQEKNHSLESKLSSLESQLVALNEKYKEEKETLAATQDQLLKNKALLEEKETTLGSLEKELKTLSSTLAANKESLASTNTKLTETHCSSKSYV